VTDRTDGTHGTDQTDRTGESDRTGRADVLRSLAADLELRDDIGDAWTAKSFTDRLFVVEVAPDAELPAEVRRTLHEYDLRESNEVYGVDAPDGSDGDREHDRITVQAGAGIVADSVPEREYEETEQKMGGVIDALERIEANADGESEAPVEEVSR